MKAILRLIAHYVLSLNTAHSMESIITLLKNSDDLSEYNEITKSDEIIFKSNKTFKNKYGTNSYVRIRISEKTINKTLENTRFIFQKRTVKYGESTIVPAPPQIRIYYPNKVVKIRIRCEDEFNINKIFDIVINNISNYKAISTNECGSLLKWHYKQR